MLGYLFGKGAKAAADHGAGGFMRSMVMGSMMGGMASYGSGEGSFMGGMAAGALGGYGASKLAGSRMISRGARHGRAWMSNMHPGHKEVRSYTSSMVKGARYLESKAGRSYLMGAGGLLAGTMFPMGHGPSKASGFNSHRGNR